MTHARLDAAPAGHPPARPRRDGASAPATARYVAIGDSIPRGFLLGVPGWSPPGACTAPQAWLLRWFDHPQRGYPALLAAAMRAQGRPVELDMSLTCTNSSSALFWRDGPTAPVRAAFQRPVHMVTVTLGANDLMGGWSPYTVAATGVRSVATALRFDPQPMLDRLAPAPRAGDAAVHRLRARLHDLLSWLVTRTDGPVVITTYHRGDDSRVVRTRIVTPVNTAIRAAATGVPGVLLVDLERVFQGHGLRRPSRDRFVSRTDGLHPTDQGHRAIAEAVLATVAGFPAAPRLPAQAASRASVPASTATPRAI